MRTRQNPAPAIPPSSAARLGLQSIPPLAACTLTIGTKDVNGAGISTLSVLLFLIIPDALSVPKEA
jgi:hypothetical protein